MKPNCPDALARAMRYLWENEDVAQAMGQKARMRFEALFTAETMSKSYLDLYQATLAKHHKSR